MLGMVEYNFFYVCSMQDVVGRGRIQEAETTRRWDSRVCQLPGNRFFRHLEGCL